MEVHWRTSFHVWHAWRSNTKWIHYRIVIDAAFWMPRQTVFLEEISLVKDNLLLGLFGSARSFTGPEDELAVFWMEFNIFELFLVDTFELCFDFGETGYLCGGSGLESFKLLDFILEICVMDEC
jgi:hypothetical protein